MDNEDSSSATITFDRHLRLNQLDLEASIRAGDLVERSSHTLIAIIWRRISITLTPILLTITRIARWTKVLARQRQPTGNFQAIPWDESINVDGSSIRLAPAGHILGAAQLVVEPVGGGRLVYTGDLNLRRRITTPAAEIVECETLVIETTFGHPRYRWPSPMRRRLSCWSRGGEASDQEWPAAGSRTNGYALGKIPRVGGDTNPVRI